MDKNNTSHKFILIYLINIDIWDYQYFRQTAADDAIINISLILLKHR